MGLFIGGGFIQSLPRGCCRWGVEEGGSAPFFMWRWRRCPRKPGADIPSHEEVHRAWNVVNAELWNGFEKMSWSDWVQRHSAVSEEDFAKDASRNRFAVLLSRTNHLSYHLGQAVLALK